MKFPLRRVALGLFFLWLASLSFASAYNARPKLIVIIVIDQFRGDYLERYRDQFGEGGFRLFLDHGANFTDCNYNYANTRTAPGHATLLSGAYSDGHGIMANEWWDPRKKRAVTSVQDDGTKLVGVSSSAPGSSPHNLLADTLGDELKLATQGKARVFGIALKDRAAIFSAAFSGDGAYWIDSKTGLWITSTYYRSDLPKWVQDFNDSKRAEKYLSQQWKDSNGNALRKTTPRPGKEGGFYELVGSSPLANDYEFEFARELINGEKLGAGPATDLLVIGLSANDLLGHEVGPDSPQVEAMTLATDHQLAGFFDFLKHQLGLANVWLALSADHGIAPLPTVASRLRIPAADGSRARGAGRPSGYICVSAGTQFAKSCQWEGVDRSATASATGAERRDGRLPMGASPDAGGLDRSVSFSGIQLKNPVIAASGTFAYGVEFEDIVHLGRLGGIVVKGLSREPMAGNPPPRL